MAIHFPGLVDTLTHKYMAIHFPGLVDTLTHKYMAIHFPGLIHVKYQTSGGLTKFYVAKRLEIY
jgi:hypothetical protein